MANPYSNLPSKSFWKTAVSEKNAFNLENLYEKKFEISRADRIATAGSCFAQHVGTNLRLRGFNVVDVEPAPSYLSAAEARDGGYGIYSARYGNVYTVRQMLQLLTDARGATVRDEDFLLKNDRYIDLLRPGTESAGYDSLEEAKYNRLSHLEHVVELFSGIDVFVFTFGLTEAWINKVSGTVYPICPDTLTDTTSGNYRFHNFTYDEIIGDFRALQALLRQSLPELRFLLTVSPVPLTATASKNHVLVATTYSKAVLRAVCGALEAESASVDYFPSFEVITASLTRGVFYEPNLRAVNPTGVSRAMAVFFGEHDRNPPAAAVGRPAATAAEDAEARKEDVVCEEILLEAFAR